LTHPPQAPGQKFDGAAFAGFDFSGNGHAGADGDLFAVNPERALVQCEGGGVRPWPRWLALLNIATHCPKSAVIAPDAPPSYRLSHVNAQSHRQDKKDIFCKA
jgi:hypothetical protein